MIANQASLVCRATQELGTVSNMVACFQGFMEQYAYCSILIGLCAYEELPMRLSTLGKHRLHMCTQKQLGT